MSNRSTPDGIRRVLERRAARLSQPKREDVHVGTRNLMVVRLRAERYGIDVREIREVQRVDTITPIPRAPEIWAGLVNVRGGLYPVLDAATYLGLDGESSQSPEVVIVESEIFVVAILVDELVGLRSIQPSEIEPAIELEAKDHREAVSGVTADLLLLLDVRVLLADPELVVDGDHSRRGSE